MASDLSAVSQEHKTGNNSATSAQTEDISSSSPAAITHSEANESLDHATSTSKTSTSAENRLRPAADVINRLIWDTKFDSNDYTIGYEDRFNGRLEANLSSWKKDLTDEEFIPQHRILYIKRKSDGEIVWDKRRRTDKIFLSGNSAFNFLGFLA
ncbi:hypothetical protein KXW98_002934 [Aspergillus fumigatus]|nr:hypothetical protein KXX45_001343 [Aspergillus fumigatus]KAH1284425.1 hypothetical protein KXX30_001065 [Aspergillus fumigatus]KAH1324600.1 hypothetical protein KXX66_006198 [Aspergillus fumigatus]KAH1346750.1 hypothetical protein KXX67_005100 [Aspergillus fumigatus]KAH1366211.1 hypothetical protein KXX33_008679 [Aspergillus fumigatus]